MRRSFIVAAAALALVGASSPAWAAKPAAPSYSITLDQAAPALGDVVTFTVTGTESLRTPVVQVACFQSGAKVWGYNAAPGEPVKLGSDWSPWLEAGGPADCTAGLYDMPWKGGRQSSTLYAETSFHAEG
jgi:hypothetical protein